jgi:hypothetical protein
MPPARFAALILAVIAAAGATVTLWVGTGLPVAVLSLGALAGAAVLWRRR